MNIKDEFLKIRPHITINNKWKFTGSFSRNPEYERNINLVTDIDVLNFSNDKKWSIAENIIFDHGISNLYFTYLRCGTDVEFAIDWQIENINNLSNIDVKNIKERIIDLYDKKYITEEEYKRWINYIQTPLTLKGLLLLEIEMDDKATLRWNINDIKQGYKISSGVKYYVKDAYENNEVNKYIFNDTNRATFHWIWNLNNYLIPIDINIVEDKQLSKPKRTFYKESFLHYYEKNWYKLCRSLKLVAGQFGLINIYKDIIKFTENELAVHKKILSKLKMIQYYSDAKKYPLVDQKVLLNFYNEVKKDFSKVGFKTDHDDINVVYTEFKNWLNEKMIPYYNEYRKELIQENSEISKLIPPDIV